MKRSPDGAGFVREARLLLHRGGPPGGGPSLVLGIAIIAGAAFTLAYKTGPPAGHTGGFDEPTCHACHWDADPNPPGVSLVVRGFPSHYTPGAVYPLTVHLAGASLGRGGFQLAIRVASGERAGHNAGVLEATDHRASVARAEVSDVLYAQHVLAGTTPLWTDSTQWVLRWTAPPSSTGPIVLHAAANAANGDDSEFGDRIYHASFHAEPDGKESRR